MTTLRKYVPGNCVVVEYVKTIHFLYREKMFYRSFRSYSPILNLTNRVLSNFRYNQFLLVVRRGPRTDRYVRVGVNRRQREIPQVAPD